MISKIAYLTPLLLISHLTDANMMISDSFDYASLNLSGNGNFNGNAWYTAAGLSADAFVSSGSLVVPGQTSSGGRLSMLNDDTVQKVDLFDGASVPFITDTNASTFYINLFARVPDTSRLDYWPGLNIAFDFGTNVNPNAHHVVLTFAANLFYSNNWNVTAGDNGGAINSLDLAPLVDGETVQLLLKVNYNGFGNETIQAAINPSGTPTWLTLLDQNLGDDGFSSKWMQFRNDAGDNALNEVEFDELRIGSELSDVAFVPEPSLWALFVGLFALILAPMRQRIP